MESPIPPPDDEVVWSVLPDWALLPENALVMDSIVLRMEETMQRRQERSRTRRRQDKGACCLDESISLGFCLTAQADLGTSLAGMKVAKI
jgi:hypothetical protein